MPVGVRVRVGVGDPCLSALASSAAKDTACEGEEKDDAPNACLSLAGRGILGGDWKRGKIRG